MVEIALSFVCVAFLAWEAGRIIKTNRRILADLTGLADDVAQLYEAVANVLPRLDMHSAQLKGAGERIRTIEAKLEAVERSIDGALSQPKRDLGAVTGSISRLRVELLGGTMPPNNMPVIGAVSELRTQVEGINSRLGNKVDRMVNLDRTVVATVARDAARKEVREIELRKQPWWNVYRRLFPSQ